jgi:prophage regulatory protein
MSDEKPDRLLRLSDVMDRTGLRKTAIYGLMQAGSLPRAVKLSPRCVRWSENEITAWVAERKAVVRVSA